MERYLCIHGHFYQPPRENPWLESIEFQESAYPYHDWNERVTAESYRPNSASRILDSKGRIVRIVNNYERMSFNFGPTLLAWMQQEAPETYRRILQADVRSRERFSGHGSALAQAYNHLIMPLANRRDKVTQVIWGIRDFVSRFERPPEGMWLPETAVDTETLEVLAEQGIRFTILEPGQAKRVRPLGASKWTSVEGARIDPTRAYLARLPSGREISLFFYDGPISRAVAFEKLLERGERLADRLTGAFDPKREWSQLVNIATDGETYGHHHPHGDMALAFAIETLDQRPDVKLTVYAEHLEMHPPEWEVEINERTSWSCAHGVERWASDCGCETGGREEWNQEWRAPLREALDWLRDEVAPLYEEAARELLHDAWAARNDYIDVVLDRSPGRVDAFLGAHATRELNPSERVRVLELLELQRHAMLMFTSCGWFFHELSGIETVQIIQYAGRVVQLAERLFERSIEELFLQRLDQARSNLEEHGTGRTIYENRVRPTMIDLPRVAAHHAVASLFDTSSSESPLYCYEIDRLDYSETAVGRSKVAVGQVRITSRITRASEELTYGVLYMGDLSFVGGVRTFRGDDAYDRLRQQLNDPFGRSDFPAVIRLLDQELGSLTFSIHSLFRDEQRRVLSAIWTQTLHEAEGLYRPLYDRYVPLMRFQADVGVPLPTVLRHAASFAVNMHLLHELEKPSPEPWRIRTLLEDVQAGHVDVDQETLSRPLRQRVEEMVQQLREAPESLLILQKLNETLATIEELPFRVDLWRLQNAVYGVAQDDLPAIRERAAAGDEGAQAWLEEFFDLGTRLNVFSEHWALAEA